jgi:hypothetical protein
MRGIALHRVAALAVAVLVGAGACRNETVVEPGALMLALSVAPGAAAPDELRVSVYDDTGTLWKQARVPQSGALVPESGSRLGSILVQPGATSGSVRLHVRGLLAGARALDGLLVVSPADRSRRSFDLTLDPALPPDGDADGVPDPIDDCPAESNPDQGGCAADGGDGGPDGATGTDAAADGPDSDAGVGPGPCADGGCDRPIGAACSDQLECLSGFCVDGVCCEGACMGLCRSCNQPGSDGRCLAYQQGTDPNRECTTGLTCNGVGSCGPPPTGSKQRGELCAAGSECASGYCADGVCCASACTDPCRTCASGTCVDVRRQQDAPECVAPMTCNASARCVAQ